MKRLLLLLTVALVTFGWAQAQRFALIDSEYILKQIPAYEQATKQMETYTKQWQQEIQKQSDTAKKMYEEYQKMASGLTETQRTLKEQAIVNQEKTVKDLSNKYFGPNGQLQQKRQELIQPFQDRIYEAVKTFATRNGYDVIFDRATAQSMLFASPRIDVSNEILKLLGD